MGVDTGPQRAADGALAAAPTEGADQTAVVLFYLYENLGQLRSRELAAEQRAIGERLRLVGRVLVASEGINGTVQGRAEAVAEYEAAVEAALGASIDWKRSAAGAEALFPDFAVKEVPELVSFGLPDRDSRPVDVRAEAGTRLSPEDFHKVLGATPPDDLRVVDVRNTFEHEVGHFEGAIDPGMTHTAQWPRFVNSHLEELRGRKVLLYCTGGIRCEKASAYLCRRLKETAPAPDPADPGGGAASPGGEASVYQLEGGIHRYLEAFPDGGRFRGANFVFDRRGQTRSDGDDCRAGATAVGRCSECGDGWERHHGGRVCCVCRALVLVCDACDASSAHGEYWCSDHAGLRGVYFHFLDRFGLEELAALERALEGALAAQEVGARGKNRRATLRKKLAQVQEAAAELLRTGRPPGKPGRRCRACERAYDECPGECWGFWKRPAPLAWDTPST